MIKSMTGFGRGESRTKDGTIVVEMRSVNHRFFEVTSRLPEGLSFFENRIKEYIRRKIKRGRVSLSLSLERAGEQEGRIFIDEKIVRRTYHELLKLKRDLKLKGDIGIDQIISFPNVLTYQVKERNFAKLWPQVEKALEGALRALIKMRKAEGKSLYDDLIVHARVIEGALNRIKRRVPSVLSHYRARLLERLRDLSDSPDIDKDRLELEVAIFAKNCDITEELTRIASHLQSFKKSLLLHTDVGRKLDFIAQELYREINTIGAKAGDFNISEGVIQIKSEIEKIREQVQNIE